MTTARASKPLVALVGRPNVGKSTLFNRLAGARIAIVADVPGTTRDRLYADADWAGRTFSVVDTGGLDVGASADLSLRVANQAVLAAEEADVVILVTDAGDGVTEADRDVAELLRRAGKPVVVAVNKAEQQGRRMDASEFWLLGLGEPHAVSALHGTAVGDLLDAVVRLLPDAAGSEETDAGLSVAIVGRPNVGKSSLVNRLLGRERSIVSAEAGTTRDTVDERLEHGGREYVLIDTAGLRRRGRIEPGIERYSVLRATRAIERSDIAVLVIDAVDGVTAQDAHIAGIVHDAGRGAILAVNKWDLVAKDTRTADAFALQLRHELKFLDYAPIVFISALTGQRAFKVLDLASEVDAHRRVRVPTAELNRLVAELQARHDLRRKGRALKLRYATQLGVAPPSFVFFVNDRSLVHWSYERYVENRLRERYPFRGTPLRLTFRDGQAR